MARRSKKRRTDAAAAGPSAAFLAALESQRANARLREQQASPAPSPAPLEAVETPAPSQPKHLPGFYFDAAKQRYFRCAPEQRRKQARSMKIRLAPGRSAPPSSSASAAVKSAAPRRRSVLALAPHSSLQACLDRRQQSYAWSASGGDQRMLKPRFLGQFFCSQVLKPQLPGARTAQSRFTSLALHPNATNLGAVGYSNGRVGILGTESFVENRARGGIAASSGRVKVHTKQALTLLELPVGSPSSWVSSVQWRPQRSLKVLFSVVGGAPQSSGGNPTGFVSFHDVGQQQSTHVLSPREASFAPIMRGASLKWRFTDPWTASWNPYFLTGFSVGTGSDPCAAFVIPEIPGVDGILNAPRGLCQSPVVSQAYFRKSQSILNGTRTGSLWIWDLRAKRRAQELVHSTNTSSVVCLNILQDDLRVLLQRSNGELSLMDVRKYNQVLEFAGGRDDAHLPMLKFAVDDDESVVVAAGGDDPRAVTTYNIQTGSRVASVDVEGPDDQTVAPVEQVHFLRGPPGTAHPGGPELWALSRRELYMCSSWRTDIEADN